jgi:serine/threonine protein kinase/tetratricopeptide (TPR) repeat protein
VSQWTLDGCPTEDLIAAFVEGSLDDEERESIEAHIDDCKACRGVVSDLVRVFAGTNHATLPSGDTSADDVQRVAIGDSIGRYRVLEILGMGGMGVVYLAHDPELDRKVALKVIRQRGKDQADQSARLQREARAMAKLSHPNVIAVHDVGTWNDQVFVAMEFAGGGTLKGWLTTQRRDWATLASTLLAAGRGLAAAHDAGLVHRDFKPDNVLLSESGRVFVTDFGLARWGALAQAAAADGPTLDGDAVSGDTQPESLELLTRSGAFVGTPAYMAPEQFKGSNVGPACDQFAFCIVVWEALFGRRPFQANTLAALAHAVLETPTPPFPSTPSIPRRVRSVLERGLAKQPEQRFTSMHALLDALGPVRSPRLPWLVAGGLATVAIPLGALALRGEEPASADNACANLQGLSTVWSAQTRASVESAFEATELRYAAAVAQTVGDRLDDYATQWAAHETTTCSAAADGSLDPERAALRRRCLDRARTVVTRMTAGFTRADLGVVKRASKAVANLPSLETCVDDAQLSAEKPPAPPQGMAERVQRMRTAILEADADHRLGHYASGLALIDAQREEAEALGFRPLLAELAYARGRMLVNMAKDAEAEAAFSDAELHAMATRHATVLAKALILRIYAMARQRRPWEDIEPLLKRAEAALDGTRLPAPIRGALYTNASIGAFYAGDLGTSVAMAERAVSLTDRDLDPLRWATAAQTLLMAQRRVGKPDHAVERLSDIIAIYRRELGETHPDLIEAYRDLANVHKSDERFDDARIAAERALALVQDIYGPAHFEYGGTLSTLSGIEGAAERYDEALALAQRSEAVLRDAGASTQIPLAQQSEWLLALGRLDDAEPLIDRLIAEEIEARGKGPNTSWMYFIRCALESARKDVDATQAACDEAIALSGAASQPDVLLQMQLDRAEYISLAGGTEEGLAALLELEADITERDATPTTARFFRALALQAGRAHRDGPRWMQTAADQYAGLEMFESATEAETTANAWLTQRDADSDSSR